MGLTYVSATIVAKEGCEAELEAVLSGVVAEVRKEAGCIRYDLHRSDYGNVFLFYEIWKVRLILPLMVRRRTWMPCDRLRPIWW